MAIDRHRSTVSQKNNVIEEEQLANFSDTKQEQKIEGRMSEGSSCLKIICETNRF